MHDDSTRALQIRRQKSATSAALLTAVLFLSPFAFADALTLFGLGYSWGGYESLAIIFDCSDYRTATQWAPGGLGLRFHIGLEHVDDLIADLERGFAALAQAS